MLLLDIHHAMVVHGDGNLDEIALSGPTEIAEIRDGKVSEYLVTPEEFGLRRAPLTALAGGDAVANALILKSIFEGETGPRRDVVLLNAAAVLVVSGLASNIQTGITLAAQTLDSGAVTRLVTALQSI
jgi:anthranilate phosphoribosyltransferase